MSSAVITLIGLYNYEHTLFDLMELPQGVEKDLLIDSILMRGGEYEVVYPNPELLKQLIGSWSKQWSNVFNNWLRATNDMNQTSPLENYDRFENWTDTGHSHSESTDTMAGSGSTTGHDSSNGSASANNTNQISADDVDNFVNRDKSIQSNSTNTSADTSTSSQTNTRATAETSGNTSGSHEGHIHGNIGVTTAAQMYESFYNVMRQYGNIYDTIATVFCQAFVIPIL